MTFYKYHKKPETTELQAQIMNPKIAMKANDCHVRNTSNEAAHDIKNKTAHQAGTTVFSAIKDNKASQKKLSSRENSHLDPSQAELLKSIKDIIEKKGGSVVDINKERLLFETTGQLCDLQDHFIRTDQYHSLIGEILKDTDIPSLIRSKNIIPIAHKGNSGKLIELRFKTEADTYTHSLYGKKTSMRVAPISVVYNPRASDNPSTSMLRVEMDELGYTSGNPRYLFTTSLGPCICCVFFDTHKKKAVLGHFSASNFNPENLSDITKFCRDEEMQEIECHIVGGTYQYLGLENGFLTLKKYLTTHQIPIKQIFVGDTKERPKAVMLDTNDMTLFALPFDTLPRADFLSRYHSIKNSPRLAQLPLLTKDYTLSLLTCKLESQTPDTGTAQTSVSDRSSLRFLDDKTKGDS